jgi:hypothetical protein
MLNLMIILVYEVENKLSLFKFVKWIVIYIIRNLITK